MNEYNKAQIIRGRLKFILMSVLGVILFLIPITVTEDGEKQTTLAVAFLAGLLKDLLGNAMPLVIVLIITISGILSLICSTALKNKLNPEGLMNNAFNVKIVWLLL